MQLHRYLARTYWQLFISTSIGLTVLCSLVEFLERMRNAAHLSLPTLLTFVGLNMTPTWLGLIPISCWLAMIATLYQLDRTHEWHICQVLGIAPRQLIAPLLLTLLTVLGSILLAKQLFLDELAYQSREYHTRVIAAQPTHTLYQAWCQPDSTTTCAVGSYTHTTNQGTELLIYQYTDNNELSTITHAPTFTMVDTILHAPRATTYTATTGTQSPPTTLTKQLPGLARMLATHRPPHTLLDMLLLWWHTPHDTQRTQLQPMIVSELSPLFWGLMYALIALLFFFWVPSTNRFRLGLTLLTYPVLVLLAQMIP